MGRKHKSRRIFTISLFLVFGMPVAAQSPPSSDGPVFLEIVHAYRLTANCDDFYAWRLYASGRLVVESNIPNKERALSCKERQREEVQLGPDRMAQFERLTQEPDFLNASAEYVVKKVIDGGSWTTINYRKDKIVKRVMIYNFLIADDAEKANIPPSILKIIEMSAPRGKD